MADTDPKISDNEPDADAILAELEDEDVSEYRSQRLQELKSESSQSNAVASPSEAAYATLRTDDEILRFTTEYERAVVHFFHPDFARCSTMDQHVRSIASRHSEQGNADVAFGRVDVKHAPFVVEKLGIRVLPCVLGFVKGVVKGRVTGFEGICWSGKENHPLVATNLEAKLVEWTVLKRKLLEDGDDDEEERKSSKDPQSGRRGISGRKHEVQDDDDDEWD